MTLSYLLEQAEIHLFGNSARIHDLRIVVSFLANCGCLALTFGLALCIEAGGLLSWGFWVRLAMANGLLYLFGYLFSLNVLGSLGLVQRSGCLPKKPRKKKGQA